MTCFVTSPCFLIADKKKGSFGVYDNKGPLKRGVVKGCDSVGGSWKD